MKPSLTIVGGTYLETCLEPSYQALFGSGMRAAAALSGKNIPIKFFSCVGESELDSAKSICETFGFDYSFQAAKRTCGFYYHHPLSDPEVDSVEQLKIDDVKSVNALIYGMIDGNAKITGEFVVYDPQNHKPFHSNGSEANHLALVLNKNEVRILSDTDDSVDLKQAASILREREHAEIILVKNGPRGALLIDKNTCIEIPVFETTSVWPIGSGDIFSAAFAYHWMIEKKTAKDSATLASMSAAHYCQEPVLPLPESLSKLTAREVVQNGNSVYLAAPFFSMSERWLVDEFRSALQKLGNKVFSPLHDVGIDENVQQIAQQDLEGIKSSDRMLAVLNGVDPGTLFEIGYAKSIGKQVIIFSENVNPTDLTMLVGTQCEITDDFSTAVYKASW